MSPVATVIPGWLLRQSATVEPYLAWNTWGPASPLRCLVAENAGGSPGRAGTAQGGAVDLYARPGALCPAGSKVTLPDGRRGYVSASVNQTGGGLPTPDHTHITVQLAYAFGPANGETVTVVRQVAARDDAGSRRNTTTTTDVGGCAVRPLASTETDEAGRDTLTDTFEIIAPPGADITATDRLIVRGLSFDVDGTPTDTTDSMSGVNAGLRVVAKQVRELR